MKHYTSLLLTIGTITTFQAGGWNDTQAIANGKALFSANCASCHGPEGIGPQSPALQGKRTDGKLQPPALNGTAHTWHHAPDLLRKIIAQGGKTYGKGYVGWMPAFQDSLTQNDRDDILKYVHNLWPAKIKKQYDERFGI
jgi:mono/diheme cytochrome c family protein